MLDHRSFLADDPHTVVLFYRAAHRWAGRFFSDPVVLDSVVQAAMVDILVKLRTGVEPDVTSLARWIYNCTNNAVRRELTRTHRHDCDPYESGMHGQITIDAEQTIEFRRELEHLECALEACEARVRRIIEAHVHGCSYREIAATHEISEAAARQSVAQLRKRLVGERTARDKTEYLMQQAKRVGLIGHAS